MKKLLLFSFLLICGIGGYAQPFINDTNCDISVDKFCYDPGCTTVFTYPTVYISAHSSVPIWGAACGTGTYVGYTVNFPCQSITVGDPADPAPCYPAVTGSFAQCTACVMDPNFPNGFVNHNPGGDVHIGQLP